MRSNSRPPTQRQLRVGEEIRHVIADMFLRGDLPPEMLKLPPVSVMEARVSPDFSYCKVFVLPLGGTTAESIALAKELNGYKGHFRRVLGKKVRLRITPDIRFFGDEISGEVGRIEELLCSERVRRDVLKAPDESES